MKLLKKTRGRTLATLLIATFMISMFAVGVQANQFLTMEGSSLSVTSEYGAYPEVTVLDDVAFDAQSGLVTIEGTISDLNVASGGWPDTAYLEIGVRPETTKEETNAGVYMIVFGSSQSGILAIHLQDYGGQRPPCPPWPAYIPVEKAEKIDYKITLIPSGESGGTAYLELWDMEETYQEAPSQEYGYSDANTFDEDFSEARLFYSLMADGGGEPDITYSATIGDITTNIPRLYWVKASGGGEFIDDYSYFGGHRCTIGLNGISLSAVEQGVTTDYKGSGVLVDHDDKIVVHLDVEQGALTTETKKQVYLWGTARVKDIELKEKWVGTFWIGLIDDEYGVTNRFALHLWPDEGPKYGVWHGTLLEGSEVTVSFWE